MKKYYLGFFVFMFTAGLYSLPKSKEAEKVMSFFEKTYGNVIVSGQMDLTWCDRVDMAERVYKDTGTYPVIMGYDFLNYTIGKWDGLQQSQEALKWWYGDYKYDRKYKGYKGGLVTFTWHWRVGKENEFYTDRTSFRIPFVNGELDENSPEFEKIKKDLDLIAGQLSFLRDAGVPVLWRPLHEASGKWFWWGASGPEAYKALYRYMYSYFNDVKKLDNLIWVWNGQNKEWYPGDEFVDITGEDIYPINHESQKRKYLECKASSGGRKMVALTECGRIPDPEKCFDDDAKWLYFMVWNDKTAEGKFTNEDFWSGETVNSLEFRKKVYASKKVLTLDEVKPGDYQ